MQHLYCTIPINRLGDIDRHPLAPRGHGGTVFGFGLVRIPGGVLGLLYRGLDGSARHHGVRLVTGSKATIEQAFRRSLAVAFSHLVNHGLPLSHVATGGHHGDPHDHLTVGFGGKFGVVGRAVAAICHLHHRGLVRWRRRHAPPQAIRVQRSEGTIGPNSPSRCGLQERYVYILPVWSAG